MNLLDLPQSPKSAVSNSSIYVFEPSNRNLRHCSTSFQKALSALEPNASIRVVDETTSLIKLLMQDMKLKKNILIFMFSIQAKNLVVILVLSALKHLCSSNIFYLMHEPRYEKGRISPIKSRIVYLYNLVIGATASKILLPSREAVCRAKSFLPENKFFPLNLTFVSVPKDEIHRSLILLKQRWNTAKTFSSLGTSAPDKNPQGFVRFAELVNQHYPSEAQFIRAGRDRKVSLTYDQTLITTFPGYMTHSAKKYLFNLSHFVVIPYMFSTQSGVIAEALSYGKLLILNDIAAFSDFKNLSFVFMADFSKEESLLKCIEQIFSLTEQDYESKYWEAIQYFQSNHSVDYLSAKLKQILPAGSPHD